MAQLGSLKGWGDKLLCHAGRRPKIWKTVWSRVLGRPNAWIEHREGTCVIKHCLFSCIYIYYIYKYICMHRVWQALGVHYH